MTGNEEKKASASVGPPAKTPESNKKTPAQWARELNIEKYYLPGVSRYTGWKDDQPITKAEFEKALHDWLHRPIGSRKGVK